jgi:hypothetical protein
VGYIGRGEVRLGNSLTVREPDLDSAILAKFDSSGKAIWARNLSGNDVAFDNLATDGKNIFITGTVKGRDSYDFGHGVILTGLPSSRFQVLAKYDAAGSAQWAVPLPSNAPSSVPITADKSFIYVIRDQRIEAYDKYGKRSWAYEQPGGGPFYTILADGLGNLFGTCWADRKPPIEVGNGVILNAGQHFLAKYRINGSTATCIDTRVRVRTEPNLQAATVGYLDKGDKVAVLEISAEKMKIEGVEAYWYHVSRLSDGLEGWSYGQYLKLQE